jgi:hypothetical protein
MDERKNKATEAIFEKAQNNINICSEIECYNKVIEKIEALLETSAFFVDESFWGPQHFQFEINVTKDSIDIGYSVGKSDNGYTPLDDNVDFNSVIFLKVLISDIKKFIERVKLHFINTYSKVEVYDVKVTQISTIINIKIINN